MIISVVNLKTLVDCGDMTDPQINAWLVSIEQVIRKYTNNNFQNRNVRFVAPSKGNQLIGAFSYLRVGDTIQISQSQVNDGLYVVQDITEDHLAVNRELFDVANNKITKIEYPEDVVQCAADLFGWKKEFGSKVGLKSESETLSRHTASVTYEDSATLYMGYPIGILKGLHHHRKARC